MEKSMASEESVASTQIWFTQHEGRIDGPYQSSEIRHQLSAGTLTLDDKISGDRSSWQLLKCVPEVIPLELRAELGDRAALERLNQQQTLESGQDTHRHSMEGVWAPFSALVTLAVVAIVVTTWFWDPVEIGDPQCELPPGPGVDWRYCQKSDLNLADSDLSAANLTSSHLQKSNLSGSNLQQATLSYINLSGADLSYSDLQGASLKGANLKGANLTYSNLTSVNLSFADLTGATLGGAKLEGTQFDNAIWLDGEKCRAGSVDECKRLLPQ
jgi:uncharacterized protein YjbI with pentapeptide repeats